SEVDPVRRELVLVTMAGHEGHARAVDRADPDRRRGRAEGRVSAQLIEVVEELVEARAAEDADHGAVSTAAYVDCVSSTSARKTSSSVAPPASARRWRWAPFSGPGVTSMPSASRAGAVHSSRRSGSAA